MRSSVQIVFEHVEHSQAIEDRVRTEVDKLEKFFDRITSGRVSVSRPQRRHHKGDAYEIRIQLSVPGASDIVVSREPGDTKAHTDVYVAIRDAFKAARRQLQDRTRIRQDKVKTHEAPPQGQIVSLQPDSDHGFIASDDGREIYFHRNSVADDGFDELSVGVIVRFAEDIGEKGPQATYVRPLGKRQST